MMLSNIPGLRIGGGSDSSFSASAVGLALLAALGLRGSASYGLWRIRMD